ncbi:hypothetical protein H9L12_09885 [Sphingomonas rhizophila]|uniref:Uncharacterized protein n=1 Tax=Sphingomonas rhizophila TaxID=2071607 RepID=A0A7G9S9S6_9SPHN|nr:hypothetical protein [Sphingomonas rhizophila]QNN64601.1 hypothetical protein H9L12_09885 [Sphingomonas rhizophila]
MTDASMIMLAIGTAFALIGANVLVRPAATDAGRYARRIAGIMAVSLGLILAVFAFGLSEKPS